MALLNLRKFIGAVVYPPGSIYCSTNSTDPAEIWGGSWERFAQGRALIGVDENDTDFEKAKLLGGEKTHLLTINEIPSHGNHTYSGNVNLGKGNFAAYLKSATMTAYGSTGRGWDLHTNDEIAPTGRNLGGGASHNNLSPYVTVYIWRRLANFPL